jgi:hypothetical protein
MEVLVLYSKKFLYFINIIIYNEKSIIKIIKKIYYNKKIRDGKKIAKKIEKNNKIKYKLFWIIILLVNNNSK